MVTPHSFSVFEMDIHHRVKFTIEEATKAQRGSKGIALLYL